MLRPPRTKVALRAGVFVGGLTPATHVEVLAAVALAIFGAARAIPTTKRVSQPVAVHASRRASATKVGASK